MARTVGPPSLHQRSHMLRPGLSQRVTGDTLARRPDPASGEIRLSAGAMASKLLNTAHTSKFTQTSKKLPFAQSAVIQLWSSDDYHDETEHTAHGQSGNANNDAIDIPDSEDEREQDAEIGGYFPKRPVRKARKHGIGPMDEIVDETEGIMSIEEPRNQRLQHEDRAYHVSGGHRRCVFVAEPGHTHPVNSTTLSARRSRDSRNAKESRRLSEHSGNDSILLQSLGDLEKSVEHRNSRNFPDVAFPSILQHLNSQDDTAAGFSSPHVSIFGYKYHHLYEDDVINGSSVLSPSSRTETGGHVASFSPSLGHSSPASSTEDQELESLPTSKSIMAVVEKVDPRIDMFLWRPETNVNGSMHGVFHYMLRDTPDATPDSYQGPIEKNPMEPQAIEGRGKKRRASPKLAPRPKKSKTAIGDLRTRKGRTLYNQQISMSNAFTSPTRGTSQSISSEWPTAMNWTNVRRGVRNLHAELLSKVANPLQTYLFDGMLDKLSCEPDRARVLQHGYYGPKGAQVVYQSLLSMFPDIDEATCAPLTPDEFVYAVLVPEAIIYLIMMDMKIDRERGELTLLNSRKHGSDYFPLGDEEAT